MSADNGIYILQSPSILNPLVHEFRVIHAQAIENIEYDPDYHGFNKAFLLDYFGKAQVFISKEEAIMFAHEMAEQIMDSDFPILEYGVSTIRMDVPFPFPF